MKLTEEEKLYCEKCSKEADELTEIIVDVLNKEKPKNGVIMVTMMRFIRYLLYNEESDEQMREIIDEIKEDLGKVLEMRANR